MNPIKDSRRIHLTAVGLAFALFGVLDLIVLVLTPGPSRGAALIPPIFSGAVVLFTLPYLLGLFEKQQERIERQQTEIETLHAMDNAIVAEMELSRLLPVAAEKALVACDGDASGVALFDLASGKLSAESYALPDVTDPPVKTRFASLVRGGNGAGDDEWETLVAAVSGPNSVRPEGYLVVARRRIANRPFSNQDRRLLSALAGTVRVAANNARALAAARDAQIMREELKVTRASQKRDQALARAMTEGLLPDIPARLGAWVFSQRYQPQSDEAPVGGDLYDLFQIGPNRYGVFIADVSGKGLDAARKIALVKYALHSYAREHASPAEVLRHLNETLFDEPEMTGFVTLFYGVLDENERRLLWASAGHETPVLRRVNGDCETLSPTGPVLGAMPDVSFQEGETEFNPGDGLLLFTDGLSEARAAGSRNFLEIEGVERELDIICRAVVTPTRPALPVADALMAALQRFTGGKLSDDTALLWMQYAPGYVPEAPVSAAASTE